MTLFKTSFLSLISTLVKMVTSLIMNKVAAIYVGPDGYALIGQLQSASTITSTAATGAINNGVVKYTAEYNEQKDRQRVVWQTAIKITVFASLLVSMLVAVFYNELAVMLLGSEEYGIVFIWLSAAIIFMSINGVLLSIVNGKKEINKLVIANIVGSILVLIGSVILVVNYGLLGSFMALLSAPALMVLITIVVCMRCNWFNLSSLWGSFDFSQAKMLGAYTLMALTSGMLAPVIHIMIRNHLADTFGVVQAGYWQAMWKISEMYLMVITMTLSVYYVPRLSEIDCKKELKAEIIKAFVMFIPLVALGSLTIYMLRDYIIMLLFTEDFAPMTQLFSWQLAGDVVKICAWVMSLIMVAKAMVKRFVVTQLIFLPLFYILTVVLSSSVGFIAPSLAYFIDMTLYAVVVYFAVFLLETRNEAEK